MKKDITLPSCEQGARKFGMSFKKLSQDELNILFFNNNMDYLERSKIVYNEGSRIKGCFFVYSGILKVYKTGAEGKEQIIRFAKEGDLVGFRSVINQEVACTSAKVINDAILWYIPGSILTQLIKSNSEFAFELIKLACKELGESNCYLTDIAQKTVKERLAEVIVNLVEDFGLDQNSIMNITITREELANIVGTATESVIRLISEFKSEKILESRGRRLRIIDKPKLVEISKSF